MKTKKRKRFKITPLQLTLIILCISMLLIVTIIRLFPDDDLRSLSKEGNQLKAMVVEQLQEKYEEEFVVTSITEDFASGKISAILHPAKKENILFSVNSIKLEEVIEDDYIERAWDSRLEEMIEESFRKNSLSVSVYIRTTENISASLSDVYSEQWLNYSPKTISVALVMSQPKEATSKATQQFIMSLASVGALLPSDFTFHISLLNPRDYKAVDAHLKSIKQDDVNLLRHNIINRISIVIQKGMIITSLEDISTFFSQ